MGGADSLWLCLWIVCKGNNRYIVGHGKGWQKRVITKYVTRCTGIKHPRTWSRKLWDTGKWITRLCYQSSGTRVLTTLTPPEKIIICCWGDSWLLSSWRFISYWGRSHISWMSKPVIRRLAIYFPATISSVIILMAMLTPPMSILPRPCQPTVLRGKSRSITHQNWR